MKAIFLVGAVHALFLMFLIISKKKKSVSDIILAVWLGSAGLPLMLYYFNYEHFSYIYEHSKYIPTSLMFFNVPVLLLQSPLLYIYTLSYIKSESKFSTKYLIHFLPFGLFALFSFLIVDFNTLDFENFNIFDYRFYAALIIFFPITIILGFFYTSRAFFMITDFKKELKNHFSYTENIDLQWLKFLTIIIFISWTLFVLIGTLSNKIATIHNYSLLLSTVVIFIIGFLGIRNSNIFIENYKKANINKQNPQKDKAIQTPLSNETKEQIQKITDYIESEKPYLNSRLTIKELADNLNIQVYQLSKIINDGMQKNFFDFVNQYRVEEVKYQIQTNQNYTLLGIAYECGFNSKSSFNRIFKKHTGLTPSQYKKRLTASA